jgi:hypothetical protein
MTQQAPVDNPYVGPRTFSYEQRHLFFGREREARDLHARVLSERLLLFYAQSGAGKSSLLHTRLIPQLEEKSDFVVLPVGRVSGELPDSVQGVDNIYAFNLMLSIDHGDEPGRLAHVTLSEFLKRLAYQAVVDGEGREHEDWVYDATATPAPATTGAQQFALIVDQFEEIITAHPGRWSEREAFFRQLDQAMQDDPNLWVILTLREDYVAALDPYAALLTDRMRARFYMERMGVDAALDAIRKPAREAGRRPFAPGVAEKLVDDLRQVRVPGEEGTTAGQYVEPVQLQVVCFQLWEKIRERPPGEIGYDDLRDAGNVEQALADYYQEVLGAVLDQAGAEVSEEMLRGWFSTKLITETGTRGFVLQTDKHTGGLDNDVVHEIERRFLIRRETRAGGIWYELVHDTFVNPIRRSNEAWSARQSVPEIEHFAIRPRAITPGSDLWVSWKIRNADSVTLNPGGVELSGTEGTLRLKPLDPAYPGETTTFHLHAYRSGAVRAISRPLEVLIVARQAGLARRLETVWDPDLTVILGSRLDRLAGSDGGQLLDHIAALPSPLFITGSDDALLEQRLEAAGKQPTSQSCHWKGASNGSQPGPEQDCSPSIQEPLVFHLFGRDMTDEDYMDFLMRVREDREIVPLAVRFRLQRRPNLVLGFDPQAWDFKALFHGLMTWNYERRAGGIIQLEATEKQSEASVRQIAAGLAKSHLELFWGDAASLLRLAAERRG